jgi:hypothetical protein
MLKTANGSVGCERVLKDPEPKSLAGFRATQPGDAWEDMRNDAPIMAGRPSETASGRLLLINADCALFVNAKLTLLNRTNAGWNIFIHNLMSLPAIIGTSTGKIC